MTTNRSALAPPPVLGEEITALAGRDLPFGPVPPALAAAVATAVEARLSERVLALVANAQATEERTPLTSATCWHEAGRLLAGRAGRPGEAWLCHSRALAVHPEHQPARQALRRLATSTGDAGLLIGILDAEIERATDALETAALLVERAGAEAVLGQVSAALGTLREAAGLQPRSLVPRLLQLAVAPREADDAELADTLQALVEGWPGAEAEPGVRLMLALLEERLGRHDAALGRLAIGTDGETAALHRASTWATARLALRAGQPELAAESLAALARAVSSDQGSDDLARALERFRATVQALAPDLESPTDLGTDPATAAAEPGLIAALRTADYGSEARLLGIVAAVVATPGIRAALLTSAAATGLAAEPGAGEMPTEVGSLGISGRIIERLLSPETAGVGDPAAPDEPPEAGIHRALRNEEPFPLAAAIDALRDRGADEDERWKLAVASAWLRDERLAAPEEAIRGLLAAADGIDRAPLPLLIRARVSDHARLAELALAEADHAGDPAGAALRLAWAGHHLGQINPARGADLHRRALEIDPACPLALSALSRGTVDHEALAEAHASAATETDGDQRFRHLLRAGAHRLAMGAADQASLAFGQALDLHPDDVDLGTVLLRLALDHPAAATTRLLELPAATDGLPPRVLLSLGSLALGLDPTAAIEAFTRALTLDPSDPIAQQGRTEALLAAGRGSLVSAGLLEDLGRVEAPEERAWLLLRLAEIDSRHGKDWTSAVLSLLSLAELVPGHRPSLVELLLHYSRHGRHADLARVLADLARAVDDDADGAALAQMAWQGTAADLD
ncbi:MAG TPA: hypothetical protein VM285_02400, partial [Polyangia bacterium]|nr:hypothetical protein [Polyangia bacterium]